MSQMHTRFVSTCWIRERGTPVVVTIVSLAHKPGKKIIKVPTCLYYKFCLSV